MCILKLKRYKSANVFTPSVAAKINYVERNYLIQSLHDYFNTTGKQLVVFGYSGSGKTTLITNELQRSKIKFIKTPCSQDTTYQQLLLSVFDSLNVYYDRSYKYKIGASISSAYKSINAALKSENEVVSERLVPPQLNADKLATFLGAVKCYWIIEDLHKLKREEKLKVADALKIFVDKANDFPSTRIICIGAVNSSKELVDMDYNLGNRVADIYIPLLSNDEIGEIINHGFKLMNLSITNEQRKQIIDLSNNIGSVAHQLCLKICQLMHVNKTAFKTKIITNKVLEDSIKSYAEEHSDRFRSILDKVLSNGNLGLKILSLLNKSRVEEGVSLNDIHNKTKQYPVETVDVFLEDLCSQKYNQVCRYDDNAKKYKISNPFFHVYLKLFFHNEKLKSKSKSKTKKNRPRIIFSPQFAIEDYNKMLEQIIAQMQRDRLQ